MFEFGAITNTPYTGPIISQASHAPPSSDTQVPAQTQDCDDSRIGQSFRVDSQAAGGATTSIATAQSALALTDALRKQLDFIKRIAEELSMEKKLGKTDPTLTADTQDGPNLITIDGIDAFWESVRDRLKILETYSDSLYTQMQHLENATLSLVTAGESELGVRTEGITPDTAMSLAERVAGQVLNDTSTCSIRVHDLDPESVAILL